MFDSSMVNKPSGFEPLKFYCNWILRNVLTHSKGPCRTAAPLADLDLYCSCLEDIFSCGTTLTFSKNYHFRLSRVMKLSQFTLYMKLNVSDNKFTIFSIISS